MRVARVWSWANEALSEDWQLNQDFDRCVLAFEELAQLNVRSSLERKYGSLGLQAWVAGLARLDMCSMRPACCSRASCGHAAAGRATPAVSAIHFRYFWGTTVALYSAFTLKVAPHMSKTENLENVCICAVIAAMAAAST